ncbi:MAG: hypothetical protein ACUVRT_15605 [Armatimonadota bacterium]
MKRLPQLEQAIWSAAIGAGWNVVMCSLIDLLTWHLRYYSLPVGVVWSVSLETMLWRGAVVGAIVGWWLGHNRAVFLASVGGGLLLTLLYAVGWLSQGGFLRYAIDIGVTMHFVLNGLLVGVVAGLLTRYALKASLKQRTEGE